jgi:hypothetical protein
MPLSRYDNVLKEVKPLCRSTAPVTAARLLGEPLLTLNSLLFVIAATVRPSAPRRFSMQLACRATAFKSPKEHSKRTRSWRTVEIHAITVSVLIVVPAFTRAVPTATVCYPSGWADVDRKLNCLRKFKFGAVQHRSGCP